MKLGMQVGIGPGDIVLDGDPASLTETGTTAPHFSTHGYCGKTAEWKRILLGTQVRLGPNDIVAKRLDGSRWNMARR